MIFARRAMQRRLDELRPALSDGLVDALVARLNRRGKDRFAAMWETVVMHGFSKHGEITCEDVLSTGRRPDVRFVGADLSFTADVTTASDKGLDDRNPFEDLLKEIETVKSRLGLKMGGVDLKVLSREERTTRGSRTVLRLPERKRIVSFVRERIEPALRQQMAAGHAVLRVVLDDEIAGIDLTIDPKKSPYTSGGHPAFDRPTIKDKNPLFNALRSKVGQLRGVQGLRGIILGDAGVSLLTAQRLNSNEVSARIIVEDFLRQYSSIDFVLLLSIREKNIHSRFTMPSNLQIQTLLATGNRITDLTAIKKAFSGMIAEFPKPIATSNNGARRANEIGYGWGHHGGYEVSGTRIKISSRMLMELLAGKINSRELNDLSDWAELGASSGGNRLTNPFELHLSNGRLPIKISVSLTDENDNDDWIEFEFGKADPSIIPFR